MNHQDIQELQAIREYPSVSILLPVYSESADNRQQTPIRVKNLLREAENRLLKEFSKRDIAPLQSRLGELAEEIDYERGASGLALFANANFARLFYLPFAVAERVAVNHTFATRDVVIAYHRSPRYRVLSLTEKSAHLYEGVRDQLQEVERGGFPVTRAVEGVKTEWTGGFGVEQTSLHDAEEREYCNRVEHALESVADHDPLPLALAGVERTVAYFDEVTQHKGQGKFTIVARLTGNWENLPPHELEEKIWPLVQQGLKAGLDRVRQRAEDAIGAGRLATGLQEVWRAAREGRVDTVLVEDDYHQPARAQESGLHLVSEDEQAAPDVLDDAVDETIETVLNASGDVFFFESGQLAQYDRIAAILRY